MTEIATKEKSGEEVDELLPLPKTNTQVALVKPPKGVDEAKALELQQNAKQMGASLMKQLDDLETQQRVANFGMEAQSGTRQTMALLETKVKDVVLKVNGKESEIPGSLLELRMTMDKINPHSIRKGFLYRTVGWVPFIGERILQSKLRTMLLGHETVNQQIEAICNGLRDGKDNLLRDNIQLNNMYKQVKHSSLKTQEQIYLGGLLRAELERMRNESQDENEQNKLDMYISMLATRLADLQTQEQANLQFFISLDLTIQNNINLAQSVDRTVDITTPLLTVALMIQAALSRQKNVADAVNKTREYAGNLMEANADAVLQQTKEIGQLQKGTAIPLDKMESAFNKLQQALDETDRLRRETAQEADKASAQLARMSETLRPKVEKLHAATEVQLPDDLNAITDGGKQ